MPLEDKAFSGDKKIESQKPGGHKFFRSTGGHKFYGSRGSLRYNV